MSDRFAEKPFENPYRPGAGHPPPYLAGRDSELQEMTNFLQQKVILSNSRPNWLTRGRENRFVGGVQADRLASKLAVVRH